MNENDYTVNRYDTQSTHETRVAARMIVTTHHASGKRHRQCNVAVMCAALMCLCLLMGANMVFAQSGGGYNIVKSSLDCGGGTSTASGYTLKGTIAQHDAGTHTGGGYALQAGFWGRRMAVNAPESAVAPHDMTKDRYLSFDPSSNVGQQIALRVTRVGSTTPWYVGCTLQDAGMDGKLSALVSTAEFCDWTDSVIHVRGCEIVPGNEYVIEATLDDVNFSPSLSILTTAPQISASRQFGDIVGSLLAGAWTAPDGIVTVNDITAVVQKFQLNPTAPHLSRVDNDGKTPNGIIASNDILRAVVAFAGGDFGFGVTNCLSRTCIPSCP